MSCLCGEHSSVNEHLEEELQDIEDLMIINKIRYYYPNKIDKLEPIHDEQYDQWEMRYLQLCYLLNKSNELVHKHYQNIPNPHNPEDESWPVPDNINGTGMLQIDWEHVKVKQVVK